jgi:hypothetical protein
MFKEPVRDKIAVAIAALMTSCAGCAYQQRAVFDSPVSGCSVEIEQEPLFQHARVALRCPGRPTTIVLDVEHDFYIYFAHAYWTPDGGAVAVFACGSDEQKVAYDLRREEVVPFGRYEKEFDASLLVKYGKLIPPGFRAEEAVADPCSPHLPWSEQYRREYPSGWTH